MFLYTYQEHEEAEIKNPILFITTPKKMLQHIILTKHKQDLQGENYNMPMKKSREA